MIKKLFLCCSILCIMLGGVGCSTMPAMSISYQDGSMEVCSTIVLDKKALEQQNLNYDDMVAFIDDCSNDFWRIIGLYFDTEYGQYKSTPTDTQDYKISISFNNATEFKKFTKQESDTNSSSAPNINQRFLISQQILLDTNQQGSGALLDTLVGLLEKNYVTADGVMLEKSTRSVYLQQFCSIFSSTEQQANQIWGDMKFQLIYAFSADARIRSNADSVATLIANVGVNKLEHAKYTAHVYNYDPSLGLPHILLYRNCLVKDNVIEWYCLGIGVSAVFGVILWLAFWLRARKQNRLKPIKSSTATHAQTQDSTNFTLDNSL